MAATRAALGANTFAAARAAGMALTPERACAEALQEADTAVRLAPGRHSAPCAH